MKNFINNSNNPIHPLPERLKEARLARGMSALQLASELGVTRQAISRYEQGDLNPKAEILRQMSIILNFPISFFTLESACRENIDGTTFFRSLKSTDTNVRDMIKIRNSWTKSVFREYEHYLKFPQIDIPNFDDIVSNNMPLTLDIIEEIALNLRKYWGLSIGPISNMTLLLEQKGCIISGADTGQDKADACSQKNNSRLFIFLGQDKKSAVRTRFNLAHEIGHYVLHPDITDEDLKDTDILKRIEKEANMFASSFLLPRESFSMEIMSLSLQHFITLKQRWKVSIAAMIYRCHEMGIITDDQTLNLRKQMAMKRWNKCEPLDDELPIESPHLLKSATKMLIERGARSPYDLIETFKLPINDFESICGLENNTLFPENNIVHIDFKNNN